MKKAISCIMALAAAFMFVACSAGNGSSLSSPAPSGAGEAAGTAEDIISPKPSENVEEFYILDINASSNQSAGCCQLLETDSTVYYLGAESAFDYKVYFSDKEYKEWLPLCGSHSLYSLSLK